MIDEVQCCVNVWRTMYNVHRCQRKECERGPTDDSVDVSLKE